MSFTSSNSGQYVNLNAYVNQMSQVFPDLDSLTEAVNAKKYELSGLTEYEDPIRR